MLNYAENASKLHRAFGDFLIGEGLGGFTILQEVQVKSICPSHRNPLDRFDYYIRELNCVVELHGSQHYKPATFGGISKSEAVNRLHNQFFKDSAKAVSAYEAGIAYVSFDSIKEITSENFYSQLETAQDRLDSEKALSKTEKRRYRGPNF